MKGATAPSPMAAARIVAVNARQPADSPVPKPPADVGFDAAATGSALSETFTVAIDTWSLSCFCWACQDSSSASRLVSSPSIVTMSPI